MGSDRDSDRGVRCYAGWVYHVGTNSLGYSLCSDRFLVIKGKFVTMFKRDPVEYPRAVCLRFLSLPISSTDEFSITSTSNCSIKCLRKEILLGLVVIHRNCLDSFLFIVIGTHTWILRGRCFISHDMIANLTF